MMHIQTLDNLFYRQPPIGHHPKMALEKRAAQFAPFAALTGYDEALIEKGRYVEQVNQLEDDSKDQIDQSLRYLVDHQEKEVRVTYFAPDTRKDGGSIKVKTGRIKRIDPYNQNIVFSEGTYIAMKAIRKIEIAKN